MNNERVHLGSAEQLHKRRISEATNAFYRIYRYGNTLRFPFIMTRAAELSDSKSNQRRKSSTTKAEATEQLFRTTFISDKWKRIVITEGELDAASLLRGYVRLADGQLTSMVRQVPRKTCKNKSHSYRDTKRSSSSSTTMKQGVRPLNLPREYSSGRVKVARLDNYKDASDALQAGDSDAIRRAIWDAKPYRPDGIVDGKSMLDVVTAPTEAAKWDYPFKGMNDMLHGIRYGELITITAGTGSGKTSFVREIASGLCERGETVGILELEANNKRTALA